jgi:integrase/recombinase XerD
MTTFTQLTSASFHPLEPFTDQLRLAVGAYLARFKGSSRAHTESDLRATRPGAPSAAWTDGRPAAAPGAVHPVDARDLPVQALHRVTGFLGHSRVLPDLRPGRRPAAFTAEHVRRPAAPAESPTIGFTHLQLEALLTAAGGPSTGQQAPEPAGRSC